MSADDDSTQDLIARASHGDKPAMDELLARNLGGLRAYVRAQAGPLVRAKESCSDLVQSICREVLVDVDAFEYRGEMAFRRWLYQAAMRKIIDRNRHWKQEKRDAAREVQNPDDDGEGARELVDAYRAICTPSRDAAAREQLERVEKALDSLPEDYRDVLIRARFLGMSHKEIAQDMGKTEVATRHLMSRALARLATLVDDA